MCLSQSLGVLIPVDVIHLIEKKGVVECVNESSGKTIASVLHLLPDSRLSIQCKVYSDRQGSNHFLQEKE